MLAIPAKYTRARENGLPRGDAPLLVARLLTGAHDHFRARACFWPEWAKLETTRSLRPFKTMKHIVAAIKNCPHAIYVALKIVPCNITFGDINCSGGWSKKMHGKEKFLYTNWKKFQPSWLYFLLTCEGLNLNN